MRTSLYLLIVVFTAGALLAAPARAQRKKTGATYQVKALQEYIDGAFPDLFTLYRDLHAHPELSFQEKNTSAKIAGRLKALGYAVTEQVGGYGVVGVLQNGPGPTVLIRTDLDALPIAEETGLPYASR